VFVEGAPVCAMAQWHNGQSESGTARRVHSSCSDLHDSKRAAG